MLLLDKVALVTGSSRGIGATIGKQLAAEGAAVAFNYIRSRELAEGLAEDIRRKGGLAIAVQGDVRDEQDVNRMVEAVVESFGTIDIVVNNALSPYTFNPKTRKTAWELEWGDFQEQLDGSLKGAFQVCRAAAPHMTRQMSGRIINIISNLVDFPVVPYTDYTTAKAGLLGLTRTLAAELGGFGITVNALAPGLTQGTDSSRETQEDVRNAIVRLTPLGRLTLPDDIAKAAIFLASDLSAFITGQCLRVDGGLVMG